MNGFKNIEIKNFRGIDHLKIDDFSRVNVFLGQNGSGKSSILEAILMLSGMSNPGLPQNINLLRSRGIVGQYLDVRYFFHNLILTTSPELSSEQNDGVKRHLVLKMPFAFDEQMQATTPIGQIQRSDAMVQVNQVEMDFDITTELDEIDNGLHYSAYKKLWEAIFAMATATNKQVFVTTHSKETLHRLNEMLEENPAYQQEMRLYTIANTQKNGYQAYKYTYEGLSGACENDIEVRSIVIN